MFSRLVNVGGMHVSDFLLFIHTKISLIHMKFIWLVESRHACFFVLLFGFFSLFFCFFTRNRLHKHEYFSRSLVDMAEG